MAGLLSLAGVAATRATTFTPERPEYKPAGLVRYAAPEFPAMARAASVSRGSALIAVSWDARGNPTDAVTLRASDPVFGEAACEAALKWRVDPAATAAGRYFAFKFELSGVVVCIDKGASALAAEARADDALLVLDRSALDAEPKVLAQPMPETPAVPRGSFESGRVVVDFFVDQEGRVRAPRVTEATVPELIEPTLAKLRDWRYEVPLRRGRPTVYAETWAFQFRKAG